MTDEHDALLAEDKPILDRLTTPECTIYRLSWEMVGVSRLHLYCNADPATHRNTKQVVPNSQIPDEDWHPVETVTDDPWSQYNTLRQWAGEDRGFVRNVRLEQAHVSCALVAEVERLRTTVDRVRALHASYRSCGDPSCNCFPWEQVSDE